MSLSSRRSVPLRSPFQWDPWHEIEELRRALERMAERSVGRAPAGTAGLGFVPKTDLYDAGAAFVVRVDLPGVLEGDLNIAVEGSTLTIRGQREADGPRDESYLYCERPVGRFARTIELPESVDADCVRATLKQGVLEIALPKNKAATAKKVAITLGEGA
jgi:HSP20 family protein